MSHKIVIDHALNDDSSMSIENSNGVDGCFSKAIGSLDMLAIHEVCYDEIHCVDTSLVLIFVYVTWIVIFLYHIH